MSDADRARQHYFDGLKLSEAGDPAGAELKFSDALILAPGRTSILTSLSAVLLMQGRIAESKGYAERAVAADPENAEAWLNLGLCLLSDEAVAPALNCFDRAIGINSDLLQARLARANANEEIGRHEAALDDYRRATEMAPMSEQVWFDCGSACHSLGRFADALACFDRVVTIAPRHVGAMVNAGTALVSLERAETAMVYFGKALALEPDFAPAWSQAGNAQYALGRLDEALASYNLAVSLDAGSAEALHNRANVLRLLHRPEDALRDFEQSDALNAQIPFALGQFLHTKMQLCAWNELDRLQKRLTAEIRACIPCAIPFTILGASLTGNDLKSCAAVYVERKFPAGAPRPAGCAPGQGVAALGQPAAPIAHIDWNSATTVKRPLRIGYLSADFRTHPVAFLIAGVMEHHDRYGFEIFLYSCGPLTNDTEQSRLKAACSVFRDVSTLSDGAAAKIIAGDKIDVLVDLMGITKGHRLGINVLRPAPVIVNWLGYPGSLGDSRLADYIVGDPVVTPVAHADHFSETIAQMPHCYQPNDNSRAIGDRPTREAAGLPAEGFVFCSFNQSFKISPSIFDLWCRLLAEVPGSVLWLAKPHQMAIDNLRREAEVRSVAAVRLIFAPHVPSLTEHLGRLQLADLALDTFPYTSHTTGSDALWVGVPLVTRIGETYVSRVAASLLMAVGLPELVTSDAESYFVLARSLALDEGRLSSIRVRLAENCRSAPLFDTPTFTRNLEALYQEMWHRHLQGVHGPILAVSIAVETAGRT